MVIKTELYIKLKSFRSSLIILFFILSVMGTVSFVAADSPASTVYVSTSGNDSWDGLSATYNGTSGPKLTIKNATNTVSSGGTVIIADGTYSGSGNSNIIIIKSLIIEGSSRSGTILDGLDSNNIFNISAGCTVTVRDLTITNGKGGFGGGILNLGDLTVDNCEFSKCKTIYKPFGGGSAICSGDYSTLTVKNSIFTENDAKSSTNAGGAICSNGTTSIENTDFIGNQADSGAGILIFDGNLDIEGCKFINNTAKRSGGVLTIFTDISAINVHHSVFINNIANNPISTSNIDNGLNSFLNVTDNWWGSNNGPNGISGQINDSSTWIYMNSSVDNSSIMYGDKINVEANFNNIFNNNTKQVSNADVGSILDGYDVAFSSEMGSLNPASDEINSGIAKSVFTPNNVGTGNITLQFNNQILNQEITVTKSSSNIVVNNTTSTGESTNLTANLQDFFGNPLVNKVVSFMVNGTIVGNATTDNNGLVNLSYNPLNIGEYVLTAIFDGDNLYNNSNSSSKLTILPVSTKILLDNASGIVGHDISLKAYLKDVDGKPISNKMVSFMINGTVVGNATTDSSGLANLSYILTNAGSYSLSAGFAGDTFHVASNNSSTLSVIDNKNPVIKVSPKSGTYHAPISVKVSMNKKGTIYYTTDSSKPTIKSKKYTGPIKITKTTTLRFLGIDIDNKKTSIITNKYVIHPALVVSNPKNGAIQVSKSKKYVFKLKFSENLRKSINWNKIYVKNLRTGKLVSITKWIKNNNLYLKMVKFRYPTNWYRIYIPAGAVKDNSGNKLLKSYIIKFKTRK